ncbi:MAG: hypothetical protein CR997_03285 [Acidobacteria bacterium]|nr:MAG: hypothetical protein CR997_03285 [Acidobacteriota bacterium]
MLVMSADIEMVVTDLDGTLLNNQKQVSQRDWQSLEHLGKLGIQRVIATGRSYLSLKRVLPTHFPIDYLVFSSGVGIMDWSTKAVLKSFQLQPPDVKFIAQELVRRDLNFMIQDPSPHNHQFAYYQNPNPGADFTHRIRLYREHTRPWTPDQYHAASQFVIISDEGPQLYRELRQTFDQYNVVRTTSPLNHRSLWVEIYPPEVSKSLGTGEICQIAGCNPANVLAVGNDYNDLDLLNWAPHAAVVQNAPAELRTQFHTVASHNASGFSQALEHYVF